MFCVSAAQAIKQHTLKAYTCRLRDRHKSYSFAYKVRVRIANNFLFSKHIFISCHFHQFSSGLRSTPIIIFHTAATNDCGERKKETISTQKKKHEHKQASIPTFAHTQKHTRALTDKHPSFKQKKIATNEKKEERYKSVVENPTVRYRCRRVVYTLRICTYICKISVNRKINRKL